MQIQIIKAHCNECSGERKHEVLFVTSTSRTEDLDDIKWIEYNNTYRLIKCCGCENVALLHESTFSEESDEDGNPIVTKSMYPPEKYRREPKWLGDLVWVLPMDNQKIADLLREIYIVLQSGSGCLATMGIRALLEMVMIEKTGDHKTFKDNLNAFQAGGYISTIQRNVIESVLEAGHAAMHRSYIPKFQDVVAALDITENIIESVYVNSRKARNLAKNIPPRS